MQGLVCYRDTGEKNGARMLCGVRFDAAYASRGEGMLAALSAKRAAKYLQKRRVSYAVFPKDYPYAEVFARCGVLPPPEKPLRMAKAAEIIRRAMARLGLAPERARIALCAPSQSAALEAAARELSKDVRYLALCAPNGERLARTLRWDCGASVHTLQTDERIAADLSVCFDDFPLPDGLVLPLGSGAVSVAYGTENLGDAAMIWNEDQLICALYASLARRADEIWVKDVKMPPDGGENEKVKQKMPCFFNKLFCVILCIFGSTKRPPAKVPPVAYALSCYFRAIFVCYACVFLLNMNEREQHALRRHPLGQRRVRTAPA